MVDYVCTIWRTKDSGIWEVRGEPRHYVYSKLMCWVALDRGIKIAQKRNLDAPLDQWKQTLQAIRQTILERGYNRDLNTFVQSFDSDVLDATNLLIAHLGFLPAADPRFQSTLDATMSRLLTDNGLVFRYASEDNLPGQEGTFMLCSFWLVKALAISNRIGEAERVFEELLRYIGPLGLMSEEIDLHTGKQLGNLPQAFSHIGLVNSALYLDLALGREHEGPTPMGLTQDTD
jgi:GH15 family glucan-1,4-alpha-glucosidase